ncbi:MAG: GAF domain-containing protein [Bacilli bacterium]|nr:GAF domain-containing protein [Bacilli bacterium]
MKEILENILLAIKGYEKDEFLKEAHLGNILSFIHQNLGKDSWVGIYRFVEGKLILSSFQGTPACEIIKIGKGVVGTSFANKEVIYVNDVSKIENYICCDEKAKSEICLPLYKDDNIVAILDVDLPFVHDFKEEIDLYSKIAKIVEIFL